MTRATQFRDNVNIMINEIDEAMKKLDSNLCTENAKSKAGPKSLPDLEKADIQPWKKVNQFPLPLHLFEEFNSVYDTGGIMYGPSYLKSKLTLRYSEKSEVQERLKDDLGGTEINPEFVAEQFKERYKNLYILGTTPSGDPENERIINDTIIKHRDEEAMMPLVPIATALGNIAVKTLD